MESEDIFSFRVRTINISFVTLAMFVHTPLYAIAMNYHLPFEFLIYRWDVPYNEQLERKTNDMRANCLIPIIRNIRNQYFSTKKVQPKWLSQSNKDRGPLSLLFYIFCAIVTVFSNVFIWPSMWTRRLCAIVVTAQVGVFAVPIFLSILSAYKTCVFTTRIGFFGLFDSNTRTYIFA